MVFWMRLGLGHTVRMFVCLQGIAVAVMEAREYMLGEHLPNIPIILRVSRSAVLKFSNPCVGLQKCDWFQY